MDVLTTAPKRGDVIWLSLDPKRGREQKGRRPAVVLSHRQHNHAYELAIIVPITRQVKGFGVEVPLPDTCAVAGVVLCNQMQTIDWKARRVSYADQLDDETLTAILDRIDVLIK